MRAFAALDLDAASAARVLAAQGRLRADPLAPEARWVPEERLHVTLKFMASIEESLTPAIAAALERLAAMDRPLRARVAGVTAFPSVRRALAVVLLLDDADGRIAALAADLEERLASHGVAREPRALRPHVTVARLKRRSRVDGWLARAAPLDEPLALTGLTLYRSDGGGFAYTPLARFALRA